MRARNSSTKQANPNNVKNDWQGIIGIFAFHNFFTKGGLAKPILIDWMPKGIPIIVRQMLRPMKCLIRLRNYHRN